MLFQVTLSNNSLKHFLTRQMASKKESNLRDEGIRAFREEIDAGQHLNTDVMCPPSWTYKKGVSWSA